MHRFSSHGVDVEMTERRERRYQIIEAGESAWMRTFRCIVTAGDEIQFRILQRYA